MTHKVPILWGTQGEGERVIGDWTVEDHDKGVRGRSDTLSDWTEVKRGV